MNPALHPAPLSWTEFPAECLWYLVPMSLPHLLAYVVGLVVVLTLPRRDPAALLRRSRRLGLFILLFLITGSFFNGMWSCLIYGRFYDSADYVFGFIPFCPLTKNWVEMRDSQGKLMDVSLGLQIFWVLFTAATWIVTVILYRSICRRLPARPSLSPAAFEHAQ